MAVERWGSERRGLRLTAMGGVRSVCVVLAPLVPVERPIGPVEQAGHGAQGAGFVRREAEADRELIRPARAAVEVARSEEHTSELQSQSNLVCRLLLEKKKNTK